MQFNELTPEEEAMGKAIVHAAFKVHSALGPGLLEKIYVTCMIHEIRKAGFSAERYVKLPLYYDGVLFRDGLRMDILVQNLVIAQIKATEKLHPYYQAEVLNHLRLSKRRLGFLINFNVSLIKDGITRIVV
jgi:GxxExxY protein